MAVQKSKKSRSKGKSRRATKLAVPTLITDPTTGEVTRRHHVSAKGFYKGKQVASSVNEE